MLLLSCLSCLALTATAAGELPELKSSLSLVSDEEAWREAGFRVGLGYAFDQLVGLNGAPEGAQHSMVVRLGARLDQDWSILGTLRYGTGPTTPAQLRDRTGSTRAAMLRYSGTIEPTLHLGALSVALGLGIGGFVVADTGGPGFTGGPFAASYTVPDDGRILNACSGAGVLGLLRLEYPVPISPLFATGPVLEFDAQWTRCTQSIGNADPDTGEAFELHQFWGHYSIGFGWMTWWR